MKSECKTCGCAKKPPEFGVTDITDMTDDEFDAMLEKGFKDIESGKEKTADEVYKIIKQKFGI